MALAAVPIIAPIFDSDVPITEPDVDAAWEAGGRTWIDYVPLPGNGVGWDLTAARLAAATARGFVVVVIQHPRAPQNNTLSAATGAADAARAIAYCQSIGYVPGSDGVKPSLGLDMEGVKDPAQAFDHAKAWIVDVLATGSFRVVVYGGYASGLSSSQLDALAALGDVRFWCDAGPYSMRPAPRLGYALKQKMQSMLAGMAVDEDELLQDGVVFGLAFATTGTNQPDEEPHPDVTDAAA